MHIVSIGFVWNDNSYFLENIRKIFSNVVCWTFYPACEALKALRENGMNVSIWHHLTLAMLSKLRPLIFSKSDCLFDLVLTSLSISVSHIVMMSGCGRELNASEANWSGSTLFLLRLGISWFSRTRVYMAHYYNIYHTERKKKKHFFFGTGRVMMYSLLHSSHLLTSVNYKMKIWSASSYYYHYILANCVFRGWGILFLHCLSIMFWFLVLILLNNLSEGSHYLPGECVCMCGGGVFVCVCVCVWGGDYYYYSYCFISFI